MPHIFRSESWTGLPNQMDPPLREKLEVARLAGAWSTIMSARRVQVAIRLFTSAARNIVRSAGLMVAGRAWRKMKVAWIGFVRIVCLRNWKANRMAKYRDNSKSKFKAQIRYIEGETPDARHDRRQQHNVNRLDRLRNYCKSNGFGLKVTNEEMHWQIKRGKIQIDWWPRSAKMIVNKQWSKGIHVHDTGQIICYLEFVKRLGE